MEYQGIEKLHGADNWNVWKFAVQNLLRGTENAYEVCIGEILKPNPLPADAATRTVSRRSQNVGQSRSCSESNHS